MILLIAIFIILKQLCIYLVSNKNRIKVLIIKIFFVWRKYFYGITLWYPKSVTNFISNSNDS